MVTKLQLDDAVSELSTCLKSEFKKLLDDSISALKDSLIESLKASNLELQNKVEKLEERVAKLEQGTDSENVRRETDHQAGLQYNRLNSIVISGIPLSINHNELENKVINILNEVKSGKIVARDIEACHRLGNRNDAIVKFVNRKDAEDCISNRRKLANLDRHKTGIETDAPLYINEHLSPYMNKLAYFCRTLKRKSKIVALSSFRGVLKVKVEIDSRWLKIGHMVDLKNLFPNLDDILN